MSEQEINSMFPYVARKEREQQIFNDYGPDDEKMDNFLLFLIGGITVAFCIAVVIVVVVARYIDNPMF